MSESSRDPVFLLSGGRECQRDPASIGRINFARCETRADHSVDELRGRGKCEAEKSRHIRKHGALIASEEGQGAKLGNGKLGAAMAAHLAANHPHDQRDDLQQFGRAFSRPCFHQFVEQIMS